LFFIFYAFSTTPQRSPNIWVFRDGTVQANILPSPRAFLDFSTGSFNLPRWSASHLFSTRWGASFLIEQLLSSTSFISSIPEFSVLELHKAQGSLRSIMTVCFLFPPMRGLGPKVVCDKGTFKITLYSHGMSPLVSKWSFQFLGCLWSSKPLRNLLPSAVGCRSDLFGEQGSWVQRIFASFKFPPMSFWGPFLLIRVPPLGQLLG